MLMKIGRRTRRSPTQGVPPRGEKIMGFGHRIYKTVDPRSQLAKKLLRELLEKEGKGARTYIVCEAVESGVLGVQEPYHPNVDFYAAPLFPPRIPSRPSPPSSLQQDRGLGGATTTSSCGQQDYRPDRYTRREGPQVHPLDDDTASGLRTSRRTTRKICDTVPPASEAPENRGPSTWSLSGIAGQQPELGSISSSVIGFLGGP